MGAATPTNLVGIGGFTAVPVPREERMALPNPALTQIPDSYKYGWHDAEQPRTTFPKGISAEIVEQISRVKGEPEWMT